VMGGIVSNASPLIYLAKVGRMGLLRKVFGEVLIPDEVKVEVVDRGKELGEGDAYVIESAINEGWLKVLSAESMEIPIRLERGEAAVLSLAKKLGLREVLVDEVSARTAARLLDLTPRGTVFVLLRALERRELDLNEFLDLLSKMIRQGFRLKEEVYVEVVREARRIATET
jgi:predicted nucleic acid-binding protein